MNQLYVRKKGSRARFFLPVIWVVMLAALPLALSASATAESILTASDPIIAIDASYSASWYPKTAEGPTQINDGDDHTKYLNKAGKNSGFITTLSAGAIVKSFRFTSCNDHPERDPIDWTLYGTSETIVSKDNSLGDGETWDEVDSGVTDLPTARYTMGPVVNLDTLPTEEYSSYKMVFTSVRAGTSSDFLSFADAYFYDDVDGGGSDVLGTATSMLAIDTDLLTESQCEIMSSGTEGPWNLLDGSLDTKFNCKFGTEVGFIVTPSVGPTILESFKLATANDHHEDRSPTSWELYGTDDPITSENESFGDGEPWTLIGSGTMDEPGANKTYYDEIFVTGNTKSYLSYKMVFPTRADDGGGYQDTTQLSECEFYGQIIPEPATLILLLGLGLALVVRRAR